MSTVKIGTTDKKINSTKQTFSGTTLNCRLKEPCGMQSPVFRVQGLSKGNFYNYAEFEGRYYWVDDIVYITNDIQEVHCRLDPLATYKTAIGSTEALVAYADSAHWTKIIDDIRFEPEMRWNATAIANQNMFGPLNTSANGCISMTFISTCSNDWMAPGQTWTHGTGVHTALMSVQDMYKCIGDLTNFDFSGGLTEMVEAFGKAVQSLGGGSIADYIIKIIWLPFDLSALVSALGMSESDVKIGMFVGGVLADDCYWYEVKPGNIYTVSGSFPVDWQNMTGGNDFLKNERWISLQIYTPGGYQNIPLACAKWANNLYYKTAFSLTDGSWCMRLSSDSGLLETLTTFNGNLSVDMLGTVNLGNTMSGALGEAMMKFELGAIAMGIGSMAGGAAGGVTTTTVTKGSVERSIGKAGEVPVTQNENVDLVQETTSSGISGSLPKTGLNVHASSGNIGGAGSLFLTDVPCRMIVYAQVYMPYTLGKYTDYCDEYGYPCNRYLKINECSGYVQCVGASVANAEGANLANLSTINSYLNSGFYYE